MAGLWQLARGSDWLSAMRRMVVFGGRLAVVLSMATAAAARTPTPSATHTPVVKDIVGIVYDASLGPQATVAGARVDTVQFAERESMLTDAGGAFHITLRIVDGASLPLWVSADGFVPKLLTLSARELRESGRVDVGLEPAPPRVSAHIYGRVYDASAGREAGVQAQIHYEYSGAGVYPDVSGTILTDEDGLYGLSLEVGAGDTVTFTIDAPDFATYTTQIGALQLVGQPVVDFAIARRGGVLEIEPTSAEISCSGALDVQIANGSQTGEDLVVLGISLSHGYSQGDYGTGFSWDLSEYAFPLVLHSGESITLPLTYAADAFPSRLHLNVISGAREGENGGFYRGLIAGCPVVSTPTPTMTATPTAQRTGDLGTKEVQGRVYDAATGLSAGIPDAEVRYTAGSGLGSAVTDASGDFSFTLALHDTDQVTVTVAAAGYHTVQFQRSGLELWYGTTLDIALHSAAGDGRRVWGVVHDDPYCPSDSTITVTLEALGGIPPSRSVIASPRGVEFSFEGVPDGDYIVRAESDCQPSQAEPELVYVRGADVYTELFFDVTCPRVLVLSQNRGAPGTVIELRGRCYYIHSGRRAGLYFDGMLVDSVMGQTGGDYRQQFRIPPDAETGWHSLQVIQTNSVTGEVLATAGFYVDPLVVGPTCVGDCNGDGRVAIGELITGVRMGLGYSDTCAGLATDDRGSVPVNELVSAVNSALNNCR